MNVLTLDQISSMAPSARAQLYANAMKMIADGMNVDDARKVVNLIDSLGLPFSEGGGINADDPLAMAIRAVVISEEGLAACVAATKKGLPAIAGIDPLLAAKFGSDYGKHNMTTNLAGRFVSELMARNGYQQVGKMGDTPPGSVAQSGEVYGKPTC